MEPIIFLLIIIPIITAALVWTASSGRAAGILSAAGASALFIASFAAVSRVIAGGSIGLPLLNGLFRIDHLSALILIVTTFVSMLAAIYSVPYMQEEYRRKLANLRKLKIYYSLLHSFILTMIVTIISQNLGVMWIAIEATTLASAFLVGFYNNRKSIEAAWKYIIVCSVGIAFALLGIVLVYYSSIKTLGNTPFGLNWSFLAENSSSLQGSILKIAFIFILAGFGTKVGLAPMHTWLPDAHSQAPSPISALLSGVLLNTAMYGIIRVMIIVNRNLGSSIYTGRLMMAMGLVSVATASLFIMVQHDYKRMLAYSSIEHMGIIAFGIGIMSPLSVFGALFHILNHALTKSMLFMASGNIYLKYETKKTSKIHGVVRTMPVTGTVFMLGLLAITGMPPFSIFTSELLITVSAIKEGHYLGIGVLLLCLVFIFAGFVTQLLGILYGKKEDRVHGRGGESRTGAIVLIVLVAFITVSGLYIPWALKDLINSAGSIICGV